MLERKTHYFSIKIRMYISQSSMQNLHIFFKENAMQNRNFMLEVVCFWIPLEDSIILLSIMGPSVDFETYQYCRSWLQQTPVWDV